MKKFIIITTIIAAISVSAVIMYANETNKYDNKVTIVSTENKYDFNRYAGITELLH